MDIYLLQRQIAGLLYERWLTSELYTWQWYISVSVLIIVYTAWIKIVDTKRIKDLILLGSLCAVQYAVLEIVLSGALGYWSYRISILPIRPSLFVVNLSLAPVFFMIAAQQTKSWKGYAAWGCFYMGFLAFVLLPFYNRIGVYQLMNGWTFVHHFAMLLSVGVLSKAIHNWLSSLQFGKDPLEQRKQSLVLQPALRKYIDEHPDCFKDDKEYRK